MKLKLDKLKKTFNHKKKKSKKCTKCYGIGYTDLVLMKECNECKYNHLKSSSK